MFTSPVEIYIDKLNSLWGNVEKICRGENFNESVFGVEILDPSATEISLRILNLFLQKWAVEEFRYEDITPPAPVTLRGESKKEIKRFLRRVNKFTKKFGNSLIEAISDYRGEPILFCGELERRNRNPGQLFVDLLEEFSEYIQAYGMSQVYKKRQEKKTGVKVYNLEDIVGNNGANKGKPGTENRGKKEIILGGNDNIKVITSIKVVVPERLEKIMRALEKEFDEEYGLYFDIEVDMEAGTVMVVDGSYYIPKQEVGISTIEFLEQTDKKGVIHRHPSGVTNFSQTDEMYINRQFMLSLLYVDGRISKGVFNWFLDEKGRALIRIPVSSIEVIGEEVELPEGVDKIKRKSHKEVKGQSLPQIAYGNFPYGGMYDWYG